jgi:hypothetical protein
MCKTDKYIYNKETETDRKLGEMIVYYIIYKDALFHTEYMHIPSAIVN